MRYFGSTRTDPHGAAALEEWLRVKDDLLAGREPRPKGSNEPTVLDAVNHFLTAKKRMKLTGKIAAQTYDGYFNLCEFLIDHLGRNRLLTDITPATSERCVGQCPNAGRRPRQ